MNTCTRSVRRAALTGVVALLFCGTAGSWAHDWPQWLGPTRDGRSAETGLLKQWPKDGPPLAWKSKGLGQGYATVSIAEGTIYTCGDIDDGSFIVALDLTGKKRWTAKLGKPGEQGGFHGPRGTPTVAAGRVYSLGQFGELVCVDAASGQEKWRHQLTKEFGGQCGGWGYSESPLVVGDVVLCTPGGSKGTVLALNKETGQPKWQSKDWTDSAEYASLIETSIGGVNQYVQLTGKSVAGLNPSNGAVLWKAARRGSTAVIPTPICRDGSVYVSSGYGIGCNLFRVTKQGSEFSASEIYANKVMVNHHGGVIFHEGHLYGFSDGKGWTCQNFKTGEAVWNSKALGKGALTYAEGHFYLRSEDGKGRVALIEASPDGYKEKGAFDQPDRTGLNSWAHPVVCNGFLYLRDQDLLLCYDVRANSGQSN